MPKGPEEAPVYSLSVERTFPETADWTNLLAAERRLRGTAGAEPSCGTDVPAYLRAEWIFSAEASAAPRAVEEVCTELARVFPWDRWDDLLDAIREGRALVSPLVDRATLASYEIKGNRPSGLIGKTCVWSMRSSWMPSRDFGRVSHPRLRADVPGCHLPLDPDA